MSFSNFIIKKQVKSLVRGCGKTMLSSSRAINKEHKGEEFTNARLAEQTLTNRPKWKHVCDGAFVFEPTDQILLITDELSFKDVVEGVVHAELEEAMREKHLEDKPELVSIAEEELEKFFAQSNNV